MRSPIASGSVWPLSCRPSGDRPSPVVRRPSSVTRRPSSVVLHCHCCLAMAATSHRSAKWEISGSALGSALKGALGVLRGVLRRVLREIRGAPGSAPKGALPVDAPH